MAMMTQSATAECCEKGHINFLWIQESILCVLGGENFFQYEHFYEHLMWQERITNNNWQFSPDVDNFTCAKARH